MCIHRIANCYLTHFRITERWCLYTFRQCKLSFRSFFRHLLHTDNRLRICQTRTINCRIFQRYIRNTSNRRHKQLICLLIQQSVRHIRRITERTTLYIFCYINIFCVMKRIFNRRILTCLCSRRRNRQLCRLTDAGSKIFRITCTGNRIDFAVHKTGSRRYINRLFVFCIAYFLNNNSRLTGLDGKICFFQLYRRSCPKRNFKSVGCRLLNVFYKRTDRRLYLLRTKRCALCRISCCCRNRILSGLCWRPRAILRNLRRTVCALGILNFPVYLARRI